MVPTWRSNFSFFLIGARKLPLRSSQELLQSFVLFQNISAAVFLSFKAKTEMQKHLNSFHNDEETQHEWRTFESPLVFLLS